jgi:hypothetical protein
LYRNLLKATKKVWYDDPHNRMGCSRRMAMETIDLRINRKPVRLEVDGERMLLWVLRTDLDIRLPGMVYENPDYPPQGGRRAGHPLHGGGDCKCPV